MSQNIKNAGMDIFCVGDMMKNMRFMEYLLNGRL